MWVCASLQHEYTTHAAEARRAKAQIADATIRHFCELSASAWHADLPLSGGAVYRSNRGFLVALRFCEMLWLRRAPSPATSPQSWELGLGQRLRGGKGRLFQCTRKGRPSLGQQ